MCGIAGCLHREGAAPEVLPLARMLGALRHRGPEENGAALDDRCALGMARLALNDLEGGMQPLRTEDDQVWLVANGEIFNHRELRRQLEVRGHRFRTGSDCEVVLHLYEERGLDLAEPLNGDFAIALWDRRRERLLLLRDRFGVRPLFWAEHEGRLLFGSEVKALLAAGLPAELDFAGLVETLTQWAPLPPRTLFGGVRSVPPGSLLVADPDGTFLHHYWEPPYPTAGLPPLGRVELARATEELEALLDDATRLRLSADVPIGAYLSGGLDSSLLCALAMRQGADPDTFSISFTEGRFDESEHQRLVAEHLGTRHHVVRCGPDDIAAALPQVVRHAETVLLRTAPAPLLLLSGLVHEHGLKAVLTGEGADEFAIGYDLFKETAVRAFWARQPSSRLRPQLFRRLYPDIPELREISPAFLAAFFGADAADVDTPGFSHRPRWRTTGRLRRLLREDVLAEATPVQARDLAELLGRVPPGLHPVAAAQAIEVQTFLEPQLLAAQGDRMAMAHSVESRLPYLDHRVVELLGRLPVSAKLRGLEEKAMLRRIAGPLLPPAITARTKQPYRAPIGSVVTPELLDELLDPEWVAADGVLRAEAVATLRRRAAGPVGETDAMALSALASYALLRRELFAPRPVPAATLSRLWDRRYAAISGSGLNCVR